jgi:hypothetical protein
MVTEPQTGFVAEAPVVGLTSAALERALSAREHWNAIGMRAHNFATDSLNNPNIPPLIDVLLEAVQQESPVRPASAAELKRLSQFRKLAEASVAMQTRRVARVGIHHIRRILNRCRIALHRR